MKKNYQTPRLNSHGTVSKLTAASGELGFTDYFFAARGNPTQQQGSLNVCVARPGTGNCVNPKASDNQYHPTKN